MKIATVTFHRALNYGAVLQTYALQSTLESMGHDVEVLDYRSEFIEKHYTKKTFKDVLSLRQIAIIILLNGYSISSRDDFEDFSRKYIKTSPDLWSKENIKRCNNKYDLFIAGSDQIWNYKTAGFDKTYFLDFVNDNKKKNSYAASLGVSVIPEELKDDYYSLLKCFNNISVREEQGNQELSKILSRSDIKTVLDPTLLLDENEWMNLELPIQTPSKYVLLYLLGENRKIIKFAKKLARKNNCKVIYINDRLFKKFGIVNKRHIKPEEWLFLFRNANFIVTNSFHGTVFSIIFKKIFWTNYLPGKSNVNSRIVSLLGKLGLSSRIIDEGAGFDDLFIDYENVQQLLNEEKVIVFLS